jgi:hypothetical protein
MVYTFSLLAMFWVVDIILPWNSIRINTIGFYKIANDDHTVSEKNKGE